MFKISIKQIDPPQEEEILVQCYEITEDVLSVVEKLKSDETMLLASRDGEVFRVPAKEIYYVESVDNKTFIYLKKSVFDTKLKLYEIEEQCRGTKLFRCSKSMIVNIAKIRSVSSSVNGRLEAKLLNGEVVVISRQYVGAFKKKIGM